MVGLFAVRDSWASSRSKFAPEDFPDVALGQVIAELDRLWAFVSGEIGAAIAGDILFGELGILSDDKQLHRFA